MAKDDQEEAYEKILSASLLRATEFLKFAETKNAALLTFSSAWILASVSIVSSGKDLPDAFKSVMPFIVILFSISALIAISAFLPKLSLSKSLGTNARALNLLYFGDVAELGVGKFKEQVKERYSPQPDRTVTDAYLGDLATQVAVVSQIAHRKYRLFGWGARVSFIALLVMLWPALRLAAAWIWHLLP